jgi:hypothetical protein
MTHIVKFPPMPGAVFAFGIPGRPANVMIAKTFSMT